jgi:hypothetical protein
MAFKIRKSIRVGFLKFNLSGSGIGVSAGVPGFRAGTGPQGSYIYIGGNRVSYRQTSGRRSEAPRVTAGEVVHVSTAPHTPEMREIESADVSQMTDSSSAELLKELNERRKKISIAPLILIGGTVAAYFAYPRLNPVVSTAIIFVWYLLAKLWDTHRKTTVLMYGFEKAQQDRFESLHTTFTSMSQVGKLWHIAMTGNVSSHDRKYQAGASALVKRKSISLSFGEPKFIKANIPVPKIPVGRQSLHFLPDVILVVDGRKIGGLSYDSLNLRVDQSNFIESEGVPRDARVVGQTWRYVNKSGGPDRRFKDNPTIPIARYEELHFASPKGLNELIIVSRIGAGAEFAAKIREFVTCQSEPGREIRSISGIPVSPSPAEPPPIPRVSSPQASVSEPEGAELDNYPGTFDFDIVGESRYQSALSRICGGKSEEGYNKEVKALMVMENDNPNDAEAVCVTIGGTKVGYLARKDAHQFRAAMKAVGLGERPLKVPAVIVGGWDRGNGDTGYFGVKLDLPVEASQS